MDIKLTQHSKGGGCGCKIAPSPKYNQYRGEDLHHLEDTVLLTDEILDDFLYDDWEIVE